LDDVPSVKNAAIVQIDPIMPPMRPQSRALSGKQVSQHGEDVRDTPGVRPRSPSNATASQLSCTRVTT